MIINAIRQRYSVRKFKPDQVPDEMISEILEAARLAPSARNKQNWHFVVIRDDELRRKLTGICRNQKFVAEAPLTIVVCATDLDYKMSCGENAYTVDAAIAAEHIALQAAELGLGSCWIGAFNQKDMADLIGLPSDYRVVAVIPIGYPDQARPVRNLKPIEEISSFDRY